MQQLVKAAPTGIGQRPDWMPDPGVHAFVVDMLEELGVETAHLPERWIPLGIVGTLDWVLIAGWWIFENTGLFKTDEPYQWVFDYDGYEFDPDQLLIYRDLVERNKLHERLKSPGIDGVERTEAVQFLAQDVYAQMMGEDVPRSKSQYYIPPQEFIELVMYSTFMWILSEYGRDWIYMQDELFSCIYDFGVAYVCRWDQTLLDPDVMLCTGRDLNTCKVCGEGVWCVRGGYIGDDWFNVCVNCMNEAVRDLGLTGDPKDRRIRFPKCPMWPGENGEQGSCTSTSCPHNPLTEDDVWDKLHEAGSERLERYRDNVRSMGGMNPRQLAGQTADDIVEYFREEDED